MKKELALSVCTLAVAGCSDTLTYEELSPRYAFETLTLSSGLNINYRDEGPPDARTVLLLHGGGDSLNTWNGWASRLNARYRVVRFDLPGHGLSDPYPDGRHDSRRFSRSLKRFVDEYGLDDFALVGHSFGGETALHYMTEQDGRAGLLTLVGPGAYAPTDADLERAYEKIREMGTLSSLGLMSLEDSMTLMYYDTAAMPAGFMQSLADLGRYDKNQGAYQSLEEASEENYQEVSGADTIAVPTLILCGAEDLIVHVDSICRRLSREIPGSELIVYPKVGHMIPHEAESSVDDFAAFLQKVH